MQFEPDHDEGRVDEVTDVASRPPRLPVSDRDPGSIVDPPEHNIVFTSLVTGDKDIVGLVAYSIYKQNKYDWLMAFSRQISRMPNADEIQSYLFGESTPRRLATYRHLAEAMLEGRGLDISGSPSRPAPASRPMLQGGGLDLGTGAGLKSGRPWLIGIIILTLIVIGLIWFFHGGPAPSSK